MNIAICDDEENVIKSIESLIRETNFFINNIYTFTNSKKLKEKLSKESIDILFMDIKLNEESGIEFIKENSTLLEKTSIVYITGYDEYIEKVFETNPIYVLKKPINKEKIEKVFNKIVENQKKQKYILLKMGKNLSKLNTEEIIYIESFGRTAEIHLENDKSIIIYKKISELIDELPENFIRTHKSYIINLNSVESYNKKEIILNNDVRIPISRLKIKEVENIIMKYIKGMW